MATKYDVYVQSVDGMHLLTTGGAVSFQEADAVIKNWLGSYYDSISKYKYVGMYGDVIEMHQVEFETCCSCEEPIEGEPAAFFGKEQKPIHAACACLWASDVETEPEDVSFEDHGEDDRGCGCTGDDPSKYCDDCLPF